MAIDDLLDRGRDARRRRDEAANELAAVLKALEGLAGVELLDATQKRELARLRSGRAASGPADAERRCPRPPSRHVGGDRFARRGNGGQGKWPQAARRAGNPPRQLRR